jgi:hypothetical protein
LYLILDDGYFLFLLISELFAVEAVSACNDDGLRVHFGECAGDELSDVHHRSVGHSRIADDFYFSCVADFHVFTEETVFGYAEVVEQHVSVLFGVVAYFRADIAALYSWEPVVVGVFDWGEEGIDTVVFSADDGLSEDHRVGGYEG